MSWRITVAFPEEPGDSAESFPHRVGNLKEEVFSAVRDIGGVMPSDALDRATYDFTVVVDKARDRQAVLRVVERLVSRHIPERHGKVSLDRI